VTYMCLFLFLCFVVQGDVAAYDLFKKWKKTNWKIFYKITTLKIFQIFCRTGAFFYFCALLYKVSSQSLHREIMWTFFFLSRTWTSKTLA
jgi:hypothetical protein